MIIPKEEAEMKRPKFKINKRSLSGPEKSETAIQRNSKMTIKRKTKNTPINKIQSLPFIT